MKLEYVIIQIDVLTSPPCHLGLDVGLHRPLSVNGEVWDAIDASEPAVSLPIILHVQVTTFRRKDP